MNTHYNILAQSGFDISIEKTAQIICEAGFDGVFLSLNQGEIKSKDVETYKKYGLNIETLHLPYNTPFRLIDELWSNGEYKDYAINVLRQGIDFAYQQGIDTVILHASSGQNPPPITPIGISNFETIADYCLRRQVVLAIENIRRVDYVEVLLTNLIAPNVKFCFDIGHANAFTHNLYSYNWDTLFKKLHCIHIHDNNGIEDQHLIPGMGNIQFDRIVPDLMKYNPTINATLELYYHGREQFYKNMSATNFFQKAYAELKRIF